MSFITPGGVGKRVLGLKLFEDEAAASAPSITLRSEAGDIEYAAEYLADFPGAIPFTGTFDPAQTGSNVSLSNGNMTATFNGTGSVRGTFENTSGLDFVYYEFLVSSSAAPQLGSFSVGGDGFDPEQGLQALTFATVFLASNGDLVNIFGAPGIPASVAPLSSGDVLGIVDSLNDPFTYFYLNGLPLAVAEDANQNSYIAAGLA